MASTSHPVISVQDLATALRGASGQAGSARPGLLDVRWRLGGPPGIDSYHAGHLPGAVYVDLDAELAGVPGAGGRHPLPDTGDFERAMRAAGVRAGQPIVVYDDADGTIAARAWWMLRYYGHDQVQVLDGGLRAWAEAGEPVSTDDVKPAPGDFSASIGHMPVLDAAAAGELARSGILLDARAPARYRGETEPVDSVAGHIPGAVSAPTAENVTAAGQFRPVAELQERFSELGAGPGGAAECEQAASDLQPRVGVYCGSGVTAAHEVLALELAGIPAALYVGSWSGWIANPEHPVATGPQPG